MGERNSSRTRSLFTLNRREYPRYALVRRFATLISGGSREVCLVRNISAVGMMARIYRPLVPVEDVQVEVCAGQLVEGRLLWAKDWNVGIAFTELIDVAAVMAGEWPRDAETDRRRAARVKIDCPAQLRVNSRFYYGRIRDISEGGARFESGCSVKKIGPVFLVIPEMPPLSGAIRWIDGQECGVAFNEQIPIEVLDRWVSERGKAP